ncbi:hypothetical protein IB267_18195 [Ensifer sp. ENS09]|nr:hypothetical protein [Ensifer sp. ENS09]
MSKFERDHISRPDLFHGRLHQKAGAWTLSLPGLPGGVASVAFSLASGLIFNDARYPGVFSGLSRLNLGRGGGLDGCLLLRCKCFEAGALLDSQSFPFCTARFAGFNKQDALRLSGGLNWLCRRLGGPVGSEKSGLGVCSSGASVGEFVISGVSQIIILI